MNTSLEDRLLTNYDKALDIGRKILIRVCKLLLKGVPVADKCINLSNLELKRLYFNPEQINIVKSGCKLEDMDTSLLHVIIGAFGGIGPGQLQDDLKQLKENRNKQAHDRHSLSLTKRQLKTKLKNLKVLYTSILNELKKYCTPTEMSLLDTDIADIESQLVSLEKTIDDHIVEKTHALIRAAVKAGTQFDQSSAILDQSSTKLNQCITQSTTNLNSNVDQTSNKLDQSITQATANLNSYVDQSSSKLDQSITQSTVSLNASMDQSSAKLEQNICHAVEVIQQTTSDLESKVTNVKSTLEEVTLKLHQITLNNDPKISKYSFKDQNLPKTENQRKIETPIASSVTENKELILQYLCSVQQPVHVNDIAKNVGLKSKSQINPILYELVKENSIQKVSESPPLWKALAKDECFFFQKEEILSTDDRIVLEILLLSSEPIKPISLVKNTGISKPEINNLLYSMQKRGFVEKVNEIPPLWQISETGRKSL